MRSSSITRSTIPIIPPDVITSGGIIGTVDRVMEDDRIEVIIGEGTKVQIIRSTITSLLKKEEVKK